MASPLPLHGVPGAMQRRLAAVVLVGQVPVLVFAALAFWGLASAQDDPRAGVLLITGLVVAVLAVVAAALLRTRAGVTLGWIVQVATLASALLAPVAVVVGVIFTGLWITALLQGARMDALTAARERAARAG